MTAIAARTSLGPLGPAAAAARARMSNGRALDFAAMGLPGEAPPGAIGHAAPGVDPAESGVRRLLALAAPAAADLRARLSEKGVSLGPTGIYLALPPGHAEGAAAVVAEARAAARVPIAEERLFPNGCSGGAAALSEAARGLASGRIDHAIVGGCDSLLDPSRIVAALAGGRLKTEDYPVGFMPGEAAAWMLLERKALAEERPRPAEALLFEPVFAREEPAEADAPPTGKALAAAAVSALCGANAAREAGTAWLDLDGSPRRATDWAMAMVRGRRHAALDAFATEIPAMSFGAVGAAFPLLAVALATRAFQRAYAKGTAALVCASSDDGARAALVVRAWPSHTHP